MLKKKRKKIASGPNYFPNQQKAAIFMPIVQNNQKK